MPRIRTTELKIPVAPIERIERCEDGYLQGTCTILRTSFHCVFLRVRQTKNGDLLCTGSPTAQDMFNSLRSVEPEPFHTVRLPGIRGRWVLFLHPYCR